MDCSGFVSRVWEQNQKYGTSTLPNISYVISDADRKRADIYNNDNIGHAMIYYRDGVDPDYRWVYEARGDQGRVRLNLRHRDELSGYNSYRYNDITDDLHTYLPYVQGGGTWNTWIRIRNMESGTASGTVTYYNTSGSLIASRSFTVPQNGVTVLNAAWDVSGRVAALVSTDRVVAVTAELSVENPYRSTAYSGVTNGSDRLFIPLLTKNMWGSYTDFNLQNIGKDTVSVTVYHYDSQTGQERVEGPYNIPPNGFRNFDQSQNPNLPSGYYGSAMVQAQAVGYGLYTGQIVATLNLWTSTGIQSMMYDRMDSEEGRVASRAPVIVKNYYGWYSSLIVQNMGSRSTTIRMRFYQEGDPNEYSGPSDTLDPNKSKLYYTGNLNLPEGFNGSGVVDTYASNDQPLASGATHGVGALGQADEGSSIGAKWLYAPTVHNTAYIVSSINVQNMNMAGGPSATVYVYYYDQAGNYRGYQSATIQAARRHMFYLPDGGPSNFDGSAYITSDQRVAAVVNLSDLTRPGADGARSYTVPIPRADEIVP